MVFFQNRQIRTESKLVVTYGWRSFGGNITAKCFFWGDENVLHPAQLGTVSDRAKQDLRNKEAE